MTLTYRDPELHIGGIPVKVSNFVVEGEIVTIDGRQFRVPGMEMREVGGGLAMFVGALTYWSLSHHGRRPFGSDWSRGMSEVRREQRRRMKS